MMSAGHKSLTYLLFKPRVYMEQPIRWKFLKMSRFRKKMNRGAELRVTFNLESHKATLFESENINEEL